MHKTGATSDNVDTAEESAVALREDTSRTALELLKIFIDHKVKKKEEQVIRERDRERTKKHLFLIPSGAPSGSPSNDIL